jgi:hypothetical protein
MKDNITKYALELVDRDSLRDIAKSAGEDLDVDNLTIAAVREMLAAFKAGTWPVRFVARP